MFLSRNKKNNVYPCKPQFYYIKVGLKRSALYRYVFVMKFKFLIVLREMGLDGQVRNGTSTALL